VRTTESLIAIKKVKRVRKSEATSNLKHEYYFNCLQYIKTFYSARASKLKLWATLIHRKR